VLSVVFVRREHGQSTSPLGNPGNLVTHQADCGPYVSLGGAAVVVEQCHATVHIGKLDPGHARERREHCANAVNGMHSGNLYAHSGHEGKLMASAQMLLPAGPHSANVEVATRCSGTISSHRVGFCLLLTLNIIVNHRIQDESCIPWTRRHWQADGGSPHAFALRARCMEPHIGTRCSVRE